MAIPPEKHKALPLFAYGSLQIDRVQEFLMGRVAEDQVPAVAHGFLRRVVRGKDFPGLMEGDGETDGMLLYDVSKSDYSRMDAYEADFYERREIEVVAKGKACQAWAYVVPAEFTHLLSFDPWHLNMFKRPH